MMQNTANVKGLAELDRKLGQLEPKFRKRVMQKAIRAGARVIGEKARQLAPDTWVDNRPTRLKKRSNITWRVSRIRDGTARGKVTWKTDRHRGDKFSTPFPWYAHWVEFGIPSRGIPALPFLRPAFDLTYRQALRKFAEVAREGIEKESK